MKKFFITMSFLALMIAAQAQTETIDTAQFVAVYDYECKTTDSEGQGIVDKNSGANGTDGDKINASFKLWPAKPEKGCRDGVPRRIFAYADDMDWMARGKNNRA